MSVSYTNLISDADKVKIGEFHTPHDDYPVYDKHSDELIVTPTLTSGTEIGKINDISLFAPTQDEILIEQELTSGTEIGTVNDIPLFIPNIAHNISRVYIQPGTSRMVEHITNEMLSATNDFDFLLILVNKYSSPTGYNYSKPYMIPKDAINQTEGDYKVGYFTLPGFSGYNLTITVKPYVLNDKFYKLDVTEYQHNYEYIARIFTIKF
jgi:hypothetical protein